MGSIDGEWHWHGPTKTLLQAEYSGSLDPAIPSSSTGQFLDEQTYQRPNEVAVVYRWQNLRYTYSDLRTRCHQLAGELLRLGVRPGDRVAVLAGNSIEYVQLFFAITAIGALIAIVNPTLTAGEIEDIVSFISKQHTYRFYHVLQVLQVSYTYVP